MKHLRNYIIKIKGQEYNETFKTEGGMVLYGDRDFTYKKQVNAYATIVEKPMEGGILEKGTKIFIDPTIFYHYLYEDGRNHNTQFTINKKEGLYHIDPEMIILYKENNDWIGFENNFLGAQEYDIKEDTVTNGIIVDFDKKKKRDTIKVVYPNEYLLENGVGKESDIFISKIGGVPVYIEGKEFLWLRNNDVMAVQNG